MNQWTCEKRRSNAASKLLCAEKERTAQKRGSSPPGPEYKVVSELEDQRLTQLQPRAPPGETPLGKCAFRPRCQDAHGGPTIGHEIVCFHTAEKIERGRRLSDQAENRTGKGHARGQPVRVRCTMCRFGV